MSNLINGDFPVKTTKDLNATTTGVVIKASKGQIFAIDVGNANAAIRYLKIYDKATAPTNSDTPIATLLLPPTSARLIEISTAGQEFLNGISYRASTGVADNDNTAPSANDVVVNFYWM